MKRKSMFLLLMALTLVQSAGCVSWHAMPDDIGRYLKKDAAKDRERLALRADDSIAVVAAYPYEKVTVSTTVWGYGGSRHSWAYVSKMKPSTVSVQTASWLASLLRNEGIDAHVVEVITNLPQPIYAWALDAQKRKVQGVSFDTLLPQQVSRSMASGLLVSLGSRNQGNQITLDKMNEAVRDSLRALYDEMDSDTRFSMESGFYHRILDYRGIFVPERSDWQLDTTFAFPSVITLFILPMFENHYFTYDLRLHSNRTGCSASTRLKYGYTEMSSLLVLPLAPFFQHDDNAFSKEAGRRIDKDIPAFVKAVLGR